jgi:protein-disulfide isomerase
MSKKFLLGATGFAAACMLASAYLMGGAQPARADDASKMVQVMTSDGKVDRTQIEAIIRDYLLKNPEILLEVQDALDAKQKEEQRIASEGVIRQDRDEIFNSKYDGVVGNPNGKVTIVEFYDYNCGFCKRAIQDMRALTKADPDLRFVLKEFPILGPDSQKASVVSMAFHKLMPEKYGAFHNALLGGEGRATEAAAIKVALSLGEDEAKLREAMKDPEIPQIFSKTYDLANRLTITGTPSYVVGNEVVFGALGQEVLAQKIAAAKAAL